VSKFLYQNSFFKVIDCTLRDGGYYNNWDFSKNLIQSYLSAMSKTNINYVELGFRNFKKNYPMGLTSYTDDSLINSLKIPKNINIGVMINAGEFKKNNLTPLNNLKILFPTINKKIKFVRFACHFSEVFFLSECISWLRQNGITVFVNIMQISEINNKEIKKICLFLEKNKIEAIYLADSLGSLRPNSLIKIINKFKKYWKYELGLHAHNNLNLALKNSITAIKNGFNWIDSTILGMGRGPGNLKTEDILKFSYPRYILNTNKPKKKYFKSLKNNYKWGPNRYYKFAAQNKIHPTYIQEMLSDKRYNVTNYNNILKNLKKSDSRKYHPHKLFLPDNVFIGKPKGNWFPERDLFQKSILIFGPGESVLENKEKIEKFIKNNNLFVIGVNTSKGISENLVNLRTVCHPKRIISDAFFHNHSRTAISMPNSMMPDKLKNFLQYQNKIIFDFGLKLNGKKQIKIFKNFCSIPRPLVIMYSLSIAVSGKAKKIFIAGFDGYKHDDPSADETGFLLNKFKSKYRKMFLRTITKSKYDLSFFEV